ncbi:HAD family hydrolase [Alkanindiges sp. WGS2144]|uniref:HAD family hydrolase n=1 Tax=Alkanindiges sp. WGS2144 TaxID=3366808 RepID=UPI0037534548
MITAFGSFDLIIFDWDGTLFDSVSPIVDLINDAKRDVPQTEQGAALQASGLIPVLEQIIHADHAVQLDDLRLLLNLEGFKQFDKPAELYDGVADLLARLHAGGQKMAVIAGRPQAEVLAEIQRLGIAHYFFTVVGADQGPAKPNPAILQSILSLAECVPNRALLIGDSALDMEMATLARISMLGAAYLTHNHEQYCIDRLQPWQPLAVAGSVAALEQFLLGK